MVPSMAAVTERTWRLSEGADSSSSSSSSELSKRVRRAFIVWNRIPHQETPDPNFVAIREIPCLYLGGMSALTDQRLWDLDITHVISFAAWPPDELREQHQARGVRFYKRLEDDGMDFNANRALDSLMEVYNLCCSANGRLYVHCEMGRSRSVSAVIMLLAVRERIPTLAAKHGVQHHRHIGPISRPCVTKVQIWENVHDAQLSQADRAAPWPRELPPWPAGVPPVPPRPSVPPMPRVPPTTAARRETPTVSSTLQLQWPRRVPGG